MIITVTMNPSIDIAYQLDTFSIDTVNRVEKVVKTAGGKGLNVTRVLSEVGDDVVATGLVGGKLGDFLLENLSDSIINKFFKISGVTRNCIAILHEGNQTEILEKGPRVTENEGKAFLDYFAQHLDGIDVVVISGSLPTGVSEDYYAKLVSISVSAGKKVVLDCSGKSLEQALKTNIKPTVIKPNSEELSQLLGYEVDEEVDSLKKAVTSPLFTGLEWVIVSLGKNGAFAKHGEKFYKVDIPKINIVNPVGSGDATVAGIASALSHNDNDSVLLKKANVLGMLNAQEEMTGHVNMANYDILYQQIQVKEV